MAPVINETQRIVNEGALSQDCASTYSSVQDPVVEEDDHVYDDLPYAVVASICYLWDNYSVCGETLAPYMAHC